MSNPSPTLFLGSISSNLRLVFGRSEPLLPNLISLCCYGLILGKSFSVLGLLLSSPLRSSWSHVSVIHALPGQNLCNRAIMWYTPLPGWSFDLKSQGSKADSCIRAPVRKNFRKRKKRIIFGGRMYWSVHAWTGRSRCQLLLRLLCLGASPPALFAGRRLHHLFAVVVCTLSLFFNSLLSWSGGLDRLCPSSSPLFCLYLPLIIVQSANHICLTMFIMVFTVIDNKEKSMGTDDPVSSLSTPRKGLAKPEGSKLPEEALFSDDGNKEQKLKSEKIVWRIVTSRHWLILLLGRVSVNRLAFLHLHMFSASIDNPIEAKKI